MSQLIHEALMAWGRDLPTGTYAYAVIDMASMPDSERHAQTLQRMQAAGAVSILKDGRPSAQLAIPWLLPLNAQAHGRAHWDDAAKWALRGPCVTWLSSPLPAWELAVRLCRRTEAELPENQPILLRCYDPRVLPEVMSVLHPDQADSYWALGESWLYLDRGCQLQRFALNKALEVDLFEAPLRLDAKQFDMLMTASEVDSVMPELAREAPNAFLALPPEQRATFTRRCLGLADDWHVTAFGMRVMVGILALKLGEDFHRQSGWKPWIAELKKGKMNLIQVIERATSP